MCKASTEEKHPYNGHERIPLSTSTLIMGTAPPPRFQNFQEIAESYDFNFFYGSEDNYMWPILECALVNEQRLLDDMSSNECVIAAKDLLTEKNLWMRDILEKYSRKCPTSPNDSDIIPKEFTDLQLILNEGAEISMFAFTSEKSAEWFLNALGEQRIASNLAECQQGLKNWQSHRKNEFDSFKEHYSKKYGRSFATWLIGDRKISLIILPNPTGRGQKGMTLELKKALYKKILHKEMQHIGPP